jgi:3-hydroxyacyl-CoA dehydrogenase/enoyl-CoA hydratase/3-hydroxybutyryl-CoA epimerase
MSETAGETQFTMIVGGPVDPAVRYHRDGDGIVVLTLDDPYASANTMNERYQRAMAAAVERLYAEVDHVTGVIITSAKKTFFAGGDLTEMIKATPADAERYFVAIEAIKATLRRLEVYPRPVVAAINGTALGGGFEIALATQHRIAVDDPQVEIGLPEATLGLLPGGGGVTRVVRLLGLQPALMDVLLPGTRFKPEAARDQGLIDDLVADRQRLLPAARAWLMLHRDDPMAAESPWDRAGYKMPGGTPQSPSLAPFLPALPALLRKQLKGADYPAQRAILSAAVEGAATDFDTASRIESRYFVSLLTGQNAKNMIQAFFFDLQAIKSGALRPKAEPPFKPTQVAVIGAGMMGAGIAYACARSGLHVVLKDLTLEAAQRGAAYSSDLSDRAIARGRATLTDKEELLARIQPTSDACDLAGCEVVIEAVFEDPVLKATVFAEAAAYVAPDALLCSNTSTLPIGGLANGLERPADFIGLHFFSPVDKMPLVEIIRGADTGDAALAKAYDLVQLLRKTPIVVNDGRGFFTSRVIGTRVNEALRMLAEGVSPVSLERAGTQAGYPIGPLLLCDELNLELLAKIGTATAEAATRAGQRLPANAADEVIATMIALDRPSRKAGRGFYEYDALGRRERLWPGLTDQFPASPAPLPLADIKDRMLFIEALEAAACFAEGIITSSAAANIGSIMGIGFPPNSGGVAQFMVGYRGPGAGGASGEIGLGAFVNRADELARAYGDRFSPSTRLRAMAASGEGFPR